MTDPDRLSKRSHGLASELLRAGAAEQPRRVAVERTLAALGASGAAFVATTAKATGGGGSGIVPAASAPSRSLGLVGKWAGLGAVGGLVLAGAAIALNPAPALDPPRAGNASRSSRPAAPRHEQKASTATAPAEVLTLSPSSREAVRRASSMGVRVLPSPPAATAAPQPAPDSLETGALLVAEVALIDRARSLIASGQPEQGLRELRRYEMTFPAARMLPEVLFLRMQEYERLGRSSEARAVARRLVDTFPKSPHVARARKLLAP